MSHDSEPVASGSWESAPEADNKRLNFDLYVGIDYSGRETPTSRTSALQVYAAFDTGTPRRLVTPASSDKTFKNWCRQEIAEWLIDQAQKNITFIAGIDHAFSFPDSYYRRYELSSWPEFLADFAAHWPTDDEHTYVDFLIDRKGGPPDRVGSKDEFRVTERRTKFAKSVFQFSGQGAVAKSTHAGLPWLRQIKESVGTQLHFWPFDGWNVPPGTSVIAEVHPALFKQRYPREDRTPDQHDAYAIARWLSEVDRTGQLDRYLEPLLADSERSIAEREGWILGVM